MHRKKSCKLYPKIWTFSFSTAGLGLGFLGLPSQILLHLLSSFKNCVLVIFASVFLILVGLCSFLSPVTVTLVEILGKSRGCKYFVQPSILPSIPMLFMGENTHSEELINYKIYEFLLKLVHTCVSLKHANNIAI